jgi:ABC-type sugar transport system substrate-binding protein
MKLKLLCALTLLHFSCLGASLKVSLVIPDNADSSFWAMVVATSQSVADDLDVQLDVHYSDTNRFATRSAIEAITQQQDKPDYIIYRPLQGNAIEVLDILEASEIPFVTLEQGFNDAEQAQIGQPQQKYQYWLGTVIYDDVAAGDLLSQALLTQHHLNKPNKKMSITGIGGGFDRVSVARQLSLTPSSKRNNEIIVNQIFPMSWSVENVKQQFPQVHKRYPNTDAYWCVADIFALTIIEQFSLGTVATNAPILIGGFDWLPEALDKIKSGEMTASVGGHFLMAAKALLDIVEYHKGTDTRFEQKPMAKFELIDQSNVELYHPFIKQLPWPEIDYRQFSKVYSQQVKAPELNVANLQAAYAKRQITKE